MPHGDFERLTPETIDALWIRLRRGMATKPAARELGLCPGTAKDYLVGLPLPTAWGSRHGTQGPGKVVADVTGVTCVVSVCRAREATRPR